MDLQNVSDVRSALQSALTSLVSIEDRVAAAIGELRETEMRLRRNRDRFFPAGYFSDVAWDILLELDRAARLDCVFSVSDLGLDANIPLPTLLRYVIKLENDGFVTRQDDPKDGRRTLVILTEAGQAAINNTFNTVIGANLSSETTKLSANDSSADLIRSA